MSKKAARMAEALGDWPVGGMAEDGINEVRPSWSLPHYS